MRDFILDTRAAYIGPRVDIETGAEGDAYWIRPCKLPIEVADEISLMQVSLLNGKDNLDSVRDAIKDVQEGGAESLAEREMSTLIDAAKKVPKDYNQKLYRLALLHGVGEHNLTRGGELVEKGERLDAQMVDALLTLRPQAAARAADGILAYNRPLPNGSSRSSETSSGGSSEGTSSSPAS